jgi:hypothetical protein
MNIGIHKRAANAAVRVLVLLCSCIALTCCALPPVECQAVRQSRQQSRQWWQPCAYSFASTGTWARGSDDRWMYSYVNGFLGVTQEVECGRQKIKNAGPQETSKVSAVSGRQCRQLAVCSAPRATCRWAVMCGCNCNRADSRKCPQPPKSAPGWCSSIINCRTPHPHPKQAEY